MKAAVFSDYGELDVLQVRDDVAMPPDPTSSSSLFDYCVLVKAIASSVNPVDWKVRFTLEIRSIRLNHSLCCDLGSERTFKTGFTKPLPKNCGQRLEWHC